METDNIFLTDGIYLRFHDMEVMMIIMHSDLHLTVCNQIIRMRRKLVP